MYCRTISLETLQGELFLSVIITVKLLTSNDKNWVLDNWVEYFVAFQAENTLQELNNEYCTRFKFVQKLPLYADTIIYFRKRISISEWNDFKTGF